MTSGLVTDVTIAIDLKPPADLLPRQPQPHALPPLLERSDLWTDFMVADARIPMYDVPFVSIGGGMGSFMTVDYLRVAGGMPARDIRVLSNLTHPWQTYEKLATASQISRARRIRSDAASRPDNLWGFPSFALQEALKDRTIKPLIQVLLEPVFADFYTPRLGDVLDGMEREANRIGYWDMLVRGDVQIVRRRVGGGYFALMTTHPDGPFAGGKPTAGLVAFRCRDAHIAVGYSGLRYLPDLQRFREQLNDFHHVVNAYEDHEHVYEALRLRQGTVLVRGAGIVASQVLERLISDRTNGGAPTQIVHLFRTYVAGRHGPHAWARRRGRGGFAYQGFNYPKSVWGGLHRERMRQLEGADRVRLYDEIGGTTTAWRRHWQRQIDSGRRDGWYRTMGGTIEDLTLDDGALLARIDVPEGEMHVRADFVIDCTGLDGDVGEHRVLRDLLEHGGAGLNPIGRLDVDPSFRLRGSTSGGGEIYVTGAASYGGYFPGVDTFLGLQIAAQEIMDDLVQRDRCRPLTPLRSIAEWLRWVAGRRI